MKLNIRIFLIVLLFPSAIFSQGVLDFSHEDVSEKFSVLELNAEADYFSDHIQNSMVSTMIMGGRLDRESLLSMYSDMDGRNSFGGWANVGLKYRAISDSIGFSKNSSLLLEFGSEGYGYVTFPKDVFHLAFIGNANRLGETMSLSNTKSEAMLYQYAGLGIQNESTGSYFSFNLINVQQYFSSDVSTLELFTGEDATSISVEYDGEVTTNDSLRGDFLSNSGTGFSLNGRYNLRLNENQDLFSIEVRNAGFASLNSRTNILTADSSFSFYGVNINELISLDNPFNNITLEDSISQHEEQKSKVVAMPIDLNSTYYHRINKLDHLGISVRKRFFSEHSAELAVNYLHKESEKVSYNLGASYGGYGGFRIHGGLYVKWPNWNVYLTTKNVMGAFLGSSHGRSISFGISRKFKSE